VIVYVIPTIFGCSLLFYRGLKEQGMV
jgi:hypothetical protein